MLIKKKQKKNLCNIYAYIQQKQKKESPLTKHVLNNFLKN